ncbi:MAG: FtsX-like permease family protein, partial [Pseudomonadota bacterium]
FMLGPRVLTSLQAAQGTGLLSAGSLVDRSYRVALSDAAADPQAALGAARAAHPDLVWRQRTASEASETLSDFLERLTLFLTVAGLASLLVGGVGAADAMRAHMRRKTTTIAVFKALGAPAHLVQSTYLLQCGALAVLAAGAGVALGAAAPFFAAWAFGDRLPFPAALGVYPGPLLRAVAFGAVVAIAFTARPLAAARRIPAARLLRAFGLRDARPERTAPIVTALCAAALLLLSFTLTDDYVLVVVFFAAAVGAAVALAAASAGLVWLLRRLRPPRDAALRLAHANLVGPNSHARSVTMSLGLGLTLLGAVSAIDANISRQVSEVFPSTAPSLWFADIPPDAVDRFDALLGEGPGSDYERWPMLRAGVAALGGVPVSEAPGAQGSAWVREGDWGVTYSAAPFEGDTLISGAWWPADYAGPPLLSLEADQAERFDLSVGDTMTLTISGRDVTAEIANVREIDWSGGGLNFVAVFAPGALEAAGPSHVGGVRAATIAEEEAIFRSVTAAFPGVTIIRTREALTAVTDVLANVGLAVRAMSAVVVASGALVLIGAVGATLQARLRASMVMKAVGARRSHIVKALAAEYLVLGLAPALLAFVFALAAAYGVVAGPMDMDWQAPMGALGGLILAGAALTLGVGLGAMSRILAAAPWPVLRSP